MFSKISTKTRLVIAAFALPATGMAIATAPASAQADVATAQQMAESLVAALNGGSGDRGRWAQEHMLSDGAYRQRLSQLNRIARRTGELTIVDVAELDGGMVIEVRNGSGRTHAISVMMDERRPDKVLGVGMRGL